MKRLIVFASLLTVAVMANAQNCNALVLPYFGGDTARMAQYPESKLDWYCLFAQSAFYESDTIPAGAEVHSLSEVLDKASLQPMSAQYVVNLSTLSYFAYNFEALQQEYRSGTKVVYFPTPYSTHPYLVLRCIDEIYRMTEEAWSERYNN